MPPVKHALLSASSASRWLVCTAAPRFEEGLPESTSEYAEEGRLAHAIGELKVTKKCTPMSTRTYNTRLNKLKKDPLYTPEIQSMYSDIDLDANGIEMEFQASMEELLWFVNQHLANTGRGNFEGTEVKVIFDRDVLINETEVINNCKNSVGILSDETIVKMHPWVSDPEQELQRIKDEKEEAMADPYQAAFMKNRQNGGDGSGNPVTGQDGGDGDAQE